MTPTGVEHIQSCRRVSMTSGPLIAMTPTGVEHLKWVEHSLVQFHR
jgi:hypothetical protein